MIVEQYKKQTIYFDDKSNGKIKTVLKQIKGSKFLVVCSEGSRKRYGKCLKGCRTVWFSEFSPNPVYEDIKKAVAMFRAERCDGLISLGGGSAIDVCKCVKAYASMEEGKEYTEQDIRPNGIMHLAIPTTAGTGSESTHFAVMYENGKKTSVSEESLLPDFVWLVPSHIKTLPVYQKKCTMLDALCQAIESFWSVRSTDQSKQYASLAIAGILRYGKTYVSGLDEKGVSEAEIMWAANLAGRAIDITQTTAAHAMSYKITSKYQIPHGQAAAACLPSVWRFLVRNTDQCTDKRGEDYLKGALRHLTRLLYADSEEDAILTFESFYQSLHMEREVEILEKDIAELTEAVNVQRLGNFPVRMQSGDIAQAYKSMTERKEASYIYWYTASHHSLAKKERYNLFKVAPQMSVRLQEADRRVDAAWHILKTIEYGCLSAQGAANEDMRREWQNMAGSFLSFCAQYDSGVYYFKQAKKKIREMEKTYGPGVYDEKAGRLAELLQTDAKRAYVYVMEAAVCAAAQNDSCGRLAKFLGVPDDVWAVRAVRGMVHQLDLFAFHHFDETEQKLLSEIFEDAQTVRQVFCERQEKEVCRDILSFCYLQDVFYAMKHKRYYDEKRAVCEKLIAPYISAFEKERIFCVWNPQGDKIQITENDAKKALRILSNGERTDGGIRLRQKGTMWQETYDSPQEEAFLEVTWKDPSREKEYPYLARFSDEIYAFDEEAPAGKRKSIKARIKETVRKPFAAWKAHIKDRTAASPEQREAGRSFLEAKKRLIYKLFYKYRYEVDDKTILFEAYHGDRYNCNPKGIYEAILKDERYIDYKFVWAFKNVQKYKFLKEDFRTKVIRSNSRKYYIQCAKAKYIVLNLLLKPQISLKKEQTYIQTWHGKPIKAIGCGRQFETDPRRTLESTRKHYTRNGKKITKLLSPSEFFTPVMRDAFNLGKLRKEDCICETGYARNDRLYQYTEIEIEQIRQRLGIDPSKKVILYAPTWRELFGNYVEEQALGVVLRVSDSIDFEKMHKQLGDGYQILFRAHHMDAEAMDISRYEGFIIDVTNYEDVNDLYIVSDMLISDYSGTIFDFGILKRPMVYYMFDRELYTTKLQGVNIDLDELPGIITEKEEELVPAILKQFAEFSYDEKYERFNRKYNQYDDGKAGQRVIDLCMPDTVAKKTLTVQGMIKRMKKKLSFLIRLSRKLKLNVRGFFRERGLICDKNTKQLLALKNKYKGKKCYLIGNGPSLKPEDLDLIQNEITFGCNMVYKMFDKTKWRPTYHFIVDVIYTKNLYLEIKNNIRSPLITHNHSYRLMAQKPKNIIYANTLSQEKYEIRGNMMAYYIPARATVMTFMIEMAMFMGFKEIYLLGTDCTNSFTSGHFGEAYTASTLDKVNLARARVIIGDPDLTLEGLGEYRRQRSISAYEKLEAYAKKHGVKIYNATRGGALEVFERIRLEDTLKQEEKK